MEQEIKDTQAADIAAFEKEEDPDKRHQIWREKIYQGDKVPQLTLRAVIMGGLLGMLMSISNLYTTLKLGWAFGVALTACVLSYCIWNGLRVVFPKLTPMSILENNCMQSTASAAGYSTGSTIGMAFGAYLLITGQHINGWIVLFWTMATACLGVFIAVPLKRQLINREFLAFPDGIACATTLRSLYSQSKEAVQKAYSLVVTMILGAITGFLSKGDFPWQIAMNLKLPEMVSFSARVNGADLSKMPGFGFEPGLLMIGAGMIIGMRVCATMFFASVLLYFAIGPAVIAMHETASEATILRWAVWTGTSILVCNGIAAFALQWKTIARAFQSAKNVKEDAGTKDDIEVPIRWLVIGLIPVTIMMVTLEFIAFQISIPLGLLTVVMSAVLALVACRATGETNITPIGAMGKITQLVYAFLAPSNMTTNLMTASVTANAAVASADLLTDLKSGYLLGANPRRQFWAQFIGVFFGSLAIVPAWFAMVPNKEVLENYYHPPATLMWKAMAEALSVVGQGAEQLNKVIPPTAQEGILIGAAIGIILAIADIYAPRNVKKFLPSAMGLGLSWVMVFAASFGFFIGAVIGLIWSKVKPQNADTYLIPVASGAIAGESLMCAIIAMIKASQAIIK